MENLIFSLNATVPIFTLMVLGYLFRKIGLIDEKAAAWMNKFVFKVALRCSYLQIYPRRTSQQPGMENLFFSAF